MAKEQAPRGQEAIARIHEVFAADTSILGERALKLCSAYVSFELIRPPESRREHLVAGAIEWQLERPMMIGFMDTRLDAADEDLPTIQEAVQQAKEERAQLRQPNKAVLRLVDAA